MLHGRAHKNVNTSIIDLFLRPASSHLVREAHTHDYHDDEYHDDEYHDDEYHDQNDHHHDLYS